MKKDMNAFEKKVKLASNYFIFSILVVACVLFIIFSLIQIYNEYIFRMSPIFEMLVGIYLLFLAILWFERRISKSIRD